MTTRSAVVPIVAAVGLFSAIGASRFAGADEAFRPVLIVSTVVTGILTALVVVAAIHFYSRPLFRFEAKLQERFPNDRVYLSFVNGDAKTALAAFGERARWGTYFATVFTPGGIELWKNKPDLRQVLELESSKIRSLEPVRTRAAGQNVAAIKIRFTVGGDRLAWPLLLARLGWAGPSELNEPEIRTLASDVSRRWSEGADV